MEETKISDINEEQKKNGSALAIHNADTEQNREDTNVGKDVEEFEEDWEDYIPTPPDGGWGWVVMVASFFNNFILDGIAYCFGVFLNEYVTYFEVSVSSTSLANALLCGIYLLVGPIVGALVNKFGCRPVGIAGSILGAVAFILSMFSPNIEFFIFSYGILGGFGFGMMYLPAVVGVGYYFEKKRAIATGIAVCGTGIGTFCLAPLGKVLLREFDWKSSHLLLAALILQGCISSALMRPLHGKRRVRKAKPAATATGNNTELENGGDKADLALLKRDKPAATNGSAPNITRHRLLSSTAGSTLLRPDGTPSPAHKLHSSAYLRSGTSIVSKQDLSRPMYRKDIFFSGSVYNIAEFKKSQQNVKDYVASITSIPSVQEHESRLACLNCLPKAMADILAEMLDLHILRSKGMMVLCLANIVGMMGFYVPIIFTSDRAEKLGIAPTDAAMLLSIMGICNTVGRVLSGFLAFIPNVSPLLVNNICVTLSGIAVVLTPFCYTYTTMALAVAAYGLFCSTYISLAPVIMCELVGLEKLTNGFGLLCLVRGITAIAGPPIEGQLYDMTGNYDATFYMGGTCLLASGLLHFLLHLKMFKRQEK